MAVRIRMFDVCDIDWRYARVFAVPRALSFVGVATGSGAL